MLEGGRKSRGSGLVTFGRRSRFLGLSGILWPRWNWSERGGEEKRRRGWLRRSCFGEQEEKER